MKFTTRQTRWLALARLGVSLVALVALIFFVTSVPVYYAHVTALCHTNPCVEDQLLPAEAAKLAALHISLRFYAVYLIVLQSAYVLVTMCVVSLLLWRQSLHGFAYFTASTLVAWIFFVVDAPTVLAATSAAWGIAEGTFALGAFSSFTIFLFLFPSGRFAAPWARRLALGLVTVTLAFFAGAHYEHAGVSLVAYLLIFVLWFGAIVGMQVYRYRSVSTPVERQQTKWVIFGLAASLLGFTLLLALQAVVTAWQAGLPNALLSGVYYPFEVLIPLSIGIAILRWRLFDIDVVINRALVYGSLTALLAALYFSAVALLQALARVVTGQRQESALAIVLSTLLIAVLFAPLRQRLQRAIDRRFYRAKYDAARTLERFAATLRQDVDLAELTDHLIGAVEETMRPAHCSLWLREPSPERPPEALS